MRNIMSEKDILKLVHPGRFVEIHKEPITAANIMKKNPRHCITRPDVFEYPWIVIKPESLLMLGRVYLIVPYHTIHGLLKNYAHSKRASVPESQSQEHVGGLTSMHQEQSCMQQFQSTYRDANRVHDKYENTHFEESLQEVSTIKNRHTHAKRSQVTSNNKSCAGLLNGADHEIKLNCGKQIPTLKSCLRRKDSDRKLLYLRVSFVLPSEYEEKMRVRVSDLEFPGFLMCG